MLLIIPCGHSFRVKVSSLKKWKKVTDVTSATILKFNTAKLKGNDRLLIKFYPLDSDDGMQKSKSFHYFGQKTEIKQMNILSHSR